MINSTSPEPAVRSPGDPDLLADAHCPHCGYSLHSLPENRCPECGNAFDPAALLTTFRPKWPELMKWFIAAYVLGVVIGLSLSASYLAGLQSMPSGGPFFVTNTLRWLSKDSLLLILGTVAAVGLHRRRDWGRKVGMAAFASVFLSGILPVPLALLVYGKAFPASSDVLLYWLSQWLEGLPSLFMLIFLATGLRPLSLARRAEEDAPRLLRSKFNPRKDWLLLTVVFLAGEAMRATFMALGHFSWMQYLRSQGTPGGRTACLAGIAITTASALCLWYTMLRQWRRPQTIRLMVVVSLAAVALALGTAALVNIVAVPAGATTAGTTATQAFHAAARSLGDLLPMLAMMVFAFRDLTEEDLRLVSR